MICKKKKIVPEFEVEKWLTDLAFMVDLTHLNEWSNLYYWGRSRPWPTDNILGALAQIHDQNPNDDESPAQPSIHIPEAEGEKHDVEKFIAQFCAKAEEVIKETITDSELLREGGRSNGSSIWD
uniref:Uncharacterized protein n=1 Tax=Naja naja TaxID=35670 RepID=A0A8C6XJ98_NAJNA